MAIRAGRSLELCHLQSYVSKLCWLIADMFNYALGFPSPPAPKIPKPLSIENRKVRLPPPVYLLLVWSASYINYVYILEVPLVLLFLIATLGNKPNSRSLSEFYGWVETWPCSSQNLSSKPWHCTVSLTHHWSPVLDEAHHFLWFIYQHEWF